jgi:succinate dehydrogenase / fumarate reductase, membrane anchor subunit
MKLETDLHRAKGLGSAKKGVGHWVAQRVTAVALIPLGIWFVGTFLMLVFAPFEQTRLLLSSPWVVSVTILFIVALFYHGCLGMQVIWEDYIPHEGARWGVILATKFLGICLSLFSILSILKVYLSA